MACIALADGAGGSAEGAASAERVVACIERCALEAPRDMADRLRELDRAERGAGEATAIGIVLGGDCFWGASAGDSQAWVIGAHDAQHITRGQCRARIGSGQARTVPFTGGPIGRLLVGSDGLFKYGSQSALVRAARTPDLEGAADALLRAACADALALDDIAFVLLEWTDLGRVARPTP